MPKPRRIAILAVGLSAMLLLAQCAAPAALITAPPNTTESAAMETASPSPSPVVTSAPSPTPSPKPSPTPASTPSPSPSPTPEPTAPPDPVQEIIDAMSDEELLGQMILLGFTGKRDLPVEMAELYERYHVGGVMLFGWNVKTFAQTETLVQNINARNPYPGLPLLVGIDEEGGIVHRLPWKPATRSAAALGKRNSPKDAYDQFLRMGSKLHDLGINLDFAPVLDIAPDLSGTFLGNRMYGTNPQKVIPLTDAVIRGLHDGGVFSLGKHFPGHGNTATDSHKDLPRMGETEQRLRGYTLKPFEAAVDAGVDAMLVGHLLVPALDDENPASLSEKIMTGLLRNEMGFRGVIVSDDMRMGGIINHYDIGEACVRFVEAGGDIVFIGKYIDRQKKALRALDAAVKSGRITRARLLESAYRIVALKLKIKESQAK